MARSIVESYGPYPSLPRLRPPVLFPENSLKKKKNCKIKKRVSTRGKWTREREGEGYGPYTNIPPPRKCIKPVITGREQELNRAVLATAHMRPIHARWRGLVGWVVGTACGHERSGNRPRRGMQNRTPTNAGGGSVWLRAGLGQKSRSTSTFNAASASAMKSRPPGLDSINASTLWTFQTYLPFVSLK